MGGQAHVVETEAEQEGGAGRAGADSVGSRNGADSGKGTAALGGASLGRTAARTDLMGGSSSLRTSP